MENSRGRTTAGSLKNWIHWIPAIALGLLASAPAHADLGPMIQQAVDAQQSQQNIVVIVPVAQSPDDNYGLLTMPTADFIKQLELTDPTKLENASFKVVEDEGSDALPVGDFDGDNVLYHLMVARNYYDKLAQNADFTDPALQRKVIVRVRVDHGYNLVTHFAQWNDYNNSRYIPGSFPGDPITQWQPEVWFDASKAQLTGVDWYNIAVSSGLAVASQSWVSLSATPLEIYDHYNSGIDASKQPGVIYHEAFHYSTDAEGLFPMASEGNPVAEDYANYFGASILGRDQIADLMEYSGRYYKRDYSKVREVKDTRPLANNYNAISFGPSVLWQIREILGQQRADQLVWNSLKYINGTFLATDEQKAISSAAREDTALSPAEVSEIDALLDRYHQSYVNLELKANPGELRLLDQEALQRAAEQQAHGSEQLKREATKPGFRAKVIGALNRIVHGILVGSEDTGKALGYAGSAIFSAGNAPVNFGTDLATGIALGHGMLSENHRTPVSQVVGAGGGIASVYYSYVGLNALGYAFAAPAISAAYAGVMVDTLMCQSADPQGATGLDRYCAKNNRIMGAIANTTAKGGAKVGDAIHKEIIRIKNFFVKAFKDKDARQPATGAARGTEGAAYDAQH